MAWQELQFPLNNLDADNVETLLEELGALAVTFEDAADDALLEPAPGEQPLWPHSRVRALFDGDRDVQAVAAALDARLGEAGPRQPRIVPVADRQWETAWRRDFKPMSFGERLWVCPTDAPAPANGAAVVRLDPGLAFGTGTHPTTALCLEWLARTPLDGKTVIDYGCGSGILAIAAVKLGAARVIAIDHDAQALSATRANCAANAVGSRVVTCHPDDFAGDPVEVLTANILARPLINLAEHFAGLVAPGGRLALSGLLEAQANEVSAAYGAAFTMGNAIERHEWLLLEGRRHVNACATG